MSSDNINATAVATQLPQAPPRTHHQASGPALAAQAESIPCPRCESSNTKFCYYNNYNQSQPRHFCKSCRRYWTHGGTLRNIPVGGGTRKSTSAFNKRPRCSPATVSPCSSSPAMSGHDGVSASGAQTTGSVSVKGVTAPSHGIGSGVSGGLGLGFSSLLSTPGSNTFLALGGYGAGYVPALDGVSFGFGRDAWPFPDASLVEATGDGNFRGPVIGPTGVDAWHVGSGVGGAVRDGEGGGLIDGEVFEWPELAISMPRQGLK